MPTAKKKDEAFVREEWIYAGARLDRAGRLFHEWSGPDGDPLHFTKVKANSVGSSYSVEVNRDGDGGATVRGTGSYVHDDDRERIPTDAQLTEWRGKDAAARQQQADSRVEARAAKDHDLEEALEVVRRYYDRLRSAGDRGGFISYVYGEMTRPPRRDP